MPPPRVASDTNANVDSFHYPQPGEITISPRDGQRSAKSAWLDRTLKRPLPFPPEGADQVARSRG